MTVSFLQGPVPTGNPAMAAPADPFTGTDPPPGSGTLYPARADAVVFMCSPFLTLFRKEESEPYYSLFLLF